MWVIDHFGLISAHWFSRLVYRWKAANKAEAHSHTQGDVTVAVCHIWSQGAEALTFDLLIVLVNILISYIQ